MKKIIIGGDLNEHVGRGKQGSKRVNGDLVFEKRNKAKLRILEFAIDLVL